MLFQANVIGANLIDAEKPVGSTPQLIGSEGLIVLYGDTEGITVMTAASDESEVERRIVATFGDDATIDDLQSAQEFGPLRLPTNAHRERVALENLGHAISRCTDPDCEIHHPEVIEDHVSALNAMAWYEAGRRAGHIDGGIEAGQYAGAKRYAVSDLQVVERDDLERDLPEGVRLAYEPGKDSMGLDRVEVSALSREALVDFVRVNWGDDDDAWFQEWVVARIEEHAICEDCGEFLDGLSEKLCESCEGQRSYDKASR